MCQLLAVGTPSVPYAQSTEAATGLVALYTPEVKCSIVPEAVTTLLCPFFEALRDHRDGIDLGRVVDLFSLSIFGALG